MCRLTALLLMTCVVSSIDAQTPSSIASLVNETDASRVVAPLSLAIDSTDPLVRAAAARVVAVRNVTTLLPRLRDRLTRETDSNAAREEVRALVIGGDTKDVDFAIASTRSLPHGIDEVIARAISRRRDALELLPRLRELHVSPDAAFMTQMVWQVPTLSVVAGARFVGTQDAVAWRALLDALRTSAVVIEPNVIAASLNSPLEEIRTASIWYLVHGYAPDPSKLPPPIRGALEPKEEASLREEYGRELLRRMTGASSKEDERWNTWLQSSEADDLIGSESRLFEYFTDNEFLTRKKYCDIEASDCQMPSERKRTYPSTPVVQPQFELPDLLPPGLADAVVRGSRCRGGWLGIASAQADRAGRVQKTAIVRLVMDDACAVAVDELMKLSLVTPASIVAPGETHDILLVQSSRSAPCIDEPTLDDTVGFGLRRVGGDVKAPIVKRRVEPNFPLTAQRRMGAGADVDVIVECVISRAGCVRSIHLVAQSPFPELNGAVLQAIAQWQFLPGRLRGSPIDTIFNLTVHFKMRH